MGWHMSPRTVYPARLIGIYCILIALAMLSHKQATVEVVIAFLHNPPLIFFLGVIMVVAGLALVLGHNVWSGGAETVVVTLTSWIVLLKGAMLLFVSPEAESSLFLDTLRYEQFFYFYSSITLVLGLYLVYAASGRQAAKR